MNVFVLCTGRTASVTFTSACRRITNFTTSHEQNSRKLFGERMLYPDTHIEIDNRLTWHLGELAQSWGDRARYVHLVRDAEAVAASFDSRWGQRGSMVQAYKDAILRLPREAPDIAYARDMIATQDANIREFLSHREHVMTFRVEHWKQDWPAFWEWIGAEGDYKGARRRFRGQRNTGQVYKTRVEEEARTRPRRQLVGRIRRLRAGLLGQPD